MLSRFTVFVVASSLFACGQGDHEYATPYGVNQAMLIGPDKGGTLTDVDECDSDECSAVVERCGADSFADVMLDPDSNVLDVLCYRPNVTVKQIGLDAVVTARAGNNTVLVLDGEADAADVTGDVIIDGNNAVVYGDGPDVSLIAGSLSVEKNNAIVRGVRIQGDVTITKNNTKLAFCQIDGDLTITGNNTTLGECVVHGQLRIEGNNTVLVRNEFGAPPTLLGKNLSCNANRSFDDADSDLVVTPAELGAELVCASE
jgi:hypothetical protein